MPRLQAGDLHLWWIHLKLDNEQTQFALSLLNSSQQNKYQRRADPILKERYLAGRYYLYKLLAHYSQINEQEISLSYNRFNKPFLNNNLHQIQFNYTDTNGYGLFAFSKNVELGVDVEFIGRTGNFAPIVKKRFTNNEANHVIQPSGDINQKRFLDYWTRKEAYGKALGVGVNFKMNMVDLHSDSNIKQLSNPDLTVIQLDLPDNHTGCVVHEGHAPLHITSLSL